MWSDSFLTEFEEARIHGERLVQLMYGDLTTAPPTLATSTNEDHEPTATYAREAKLHRIPLGVVRSLPPTEVHPKGRKDVFFSRDMLPCCKTAVFNDAFLHSCQGRRPNPSSQPKTAPNKEGQKEEQDEKKKPS